MGAIADATHFASQLPMPSFPIVDSHVHLWDPGRLSYPWLSSVPRLNRSFLIGDYDRACGTVQVAKILFVQGECEQRQFPEEAEWVASIALAETRIRGIVPWAPLELGAAAEPAIERFAASPLIKGVRRIIQFEADPEFCLQRNFVEGVRLLPKYQLSFDLCVHHAQLAKVGALVRRCPNVRFILDHIGKPDIKGGQFSPWNADLRELAGFPNVWCKVSGLVTEADHQRWTTADLQPYIDHVVRCFGFGRVLFGGDWPVLIQASDYPRWVQSLDQVLHGCSADELRKFYVTNAEEFYRI